MAADLYLLEQGQEDALRLYSWKGPVLSVGYSQKTDWIPWEQIRELGIEVVRRPSGGRALLHGYQLTYSCLVLDARGSVAQEFQRITEWLARGLARLGLKTQPNRRRQWESGETDCMALSGLGELTFQGQKLVGSAQVRRGRKLLQHGCIPFASDRSLHQAVFGREPGGTDLSSLGFGSFSAGCLAEALGVECRFEQRAWSEEEQKAIEALKESVSRPEFRPQA